MIKAIFFDVDGTLLSHKINAVPESTKRAVEQLREQGILIFAATGRHILEMRKLPLEDLLFDGYVVLNGQLCLDAEGQVLAERPIHSEDMEKILPVFEKREIPITFVEKDRMYMNVINDHVRQVQDSINTEVSPLGIYEGGELYQIILYGEEQETGGIVDSLEHCRKNQWNPYGVDAIPKDGGKQEGIGKMLEYHGLTLEEIMAFGDGENDIEMLRDAGIGIAMGNASDMVKRYADYVTDDVDADGIWNALIKYELL